MKVSGNSLRCWCNTSVGVCVRRTLIDRFFLFHTKIYLFDLMKSRTYQHLISYNPSLKRQQTKCRHLTLSNAIINSSQSDKKLRRVRS